jgi:hypothetical protein
MHLPAQHRLAVRCPRKRLLWRMTSLRPPADRHHLPFILCWPLHRCNNSHPSNSLPDRLRKHFQGQHWKRQLRQAHRCSFRRQHHHLQVLTTRQTARIRRRVSTLLLCLSGRWLVDSVVDGLRILHRPADRVSLNSAVREVARAERRAAAAAAAAAREAAGTSPSTSLDESS